MKKETSKGWSEFQAKAGAWLRKTGQQAGAWLRKAGQQAGAWLRKAGQQAGVWLRKAGQQAGAWLRKAGQQLWVWLRKAGQQLWVWLRKAGQQLWVWLRKAGQQLWVWLRKAGHQLWVWLCKAGRLAGRWTKKNFQVEKGTALTLLGDGLFFKNPLLVLVMGVTCALAASDQLKSAVAMGGCTLAVLLCSALVISLTRTVLPSSLRRVASLAVIASFTAAVGMVFQVMAPNRASELEQYLPLIAVNCLLMTRTVAFDATHRPGEALVDALGAGLGYGLALAVLGLVREVLGSGSIWGVPLFGGQLHPILLLAGPSGGFLLLGAMLALVQWLRGRERKEGRKA